MRVKIALEPGVFDTRDCFVTVFRKDVSFFAFVPLNFGRRVQYFRDKSDHSETEPDPRTPGSLSIEIEISHTGEIKRLTLPPAQTNPNDWVGFDLFAFDEAAKSDGLPHERVHFSRRYGCVTVPNPSPLGFAGTFVETSYKRSVVFARLSSECPSDAPLVPQREAARREAVYDAMRASVTKAERHARAWKETVMREVTPIDGMSFCDPSVRSQCFTPLLMSTRISSYAVGYLFPYTLIERRTHVTEAWFEYFLRLVLHRRARTEIDPKPTIDARTVFEVAKTWVASHYYANDVMMVTKDKVNDGNNYVPDLYETATNCKQKSIAVAHVVTAMQLTRWPPGSLCERMQEAIKRYVPLMVTGVMYGSESHMFVMCVHETTMRRMLDVEETTQRPADEPTHFFLEGTTTFSCAPMQQMTRSRRYYELLDRFFTARSQLRYPGMVKTTKHIAQKYADQYGNEVTSLKRHRGFGEGGFRPYTFLTSAYTWWTHLNAESLGMPKHNYAFWFTSSIPCASCGKAEGKIGVRVTGGVSFDGVRLVGKSVPETMPGLFEETKILYEFEAPPATLDVKPAQAVALIEAFAEASHKRSESGSKRAVFSFFFSKDFSTFDRANFLRSMGAESMRRETISPKGGCDEVFLYDD